MFIGRERDLETLNGLYASDGFEFVVIYGRRRVGKTALINQFIRDKEAVYFVGVESNARQNLENLSKNILEYAAGITGGTSFNSFQDAFEHVFRMSEQRRMVLAIDEYPYIARSDESLASTLQMLIDKYKDTSKLMLILCGSSMSYMEDHVLAYKSPLYGRRTAQIKLPPFDFSDACRFFKGFSPEELALLYGIVGGTPQYLLQIDNSLSVEENIKKTFLNPNSVLYEEPENLLKQEVREPAFYNSVITAIANGASRMADISARVGISTGMCSAYLKSLIELGIVRKETPYGEKESRRSIYLIADNMYRFWYRFVPENSSMIERGAADRVYQRIEPQLSDYMGHVFEEICIQYLWGLLEDGKSPLQFSDLGRWWGTDARTRSQVEIDIMGDQDTDTVLLGECKWMNEKVTVGVLEKLSERSRMFYYKNVYLYLFSKTGFTKGCVEKSEEMGNVTLVTCEDIVKRGEQS